MELLSLKAGIKLKFVPFQGGGPTWKAFLGGHIDIAPAFASTVMPQLSKGNVRVLAITAPDRLPQLPDLPTMKEQGFDVQFAMFRTVFASKKTPADILAQLRAAFDKGVKDKSFQVHGEAHGRAGDLHEREELRILHGGRKQKHEGARGQAREEEIAASRKLREAE